MPEITWIKLSTDMPDDEKIKIIDTMPERDAIWVIFVKLIIQAGKCNAGGYVWLSPNKPYNDEMLATVFNRPLNTLRLALKVLTELEILEVKENGHFYLPNFEKHQNIEGMERVRQLAAERQRRQRAKLKANSQLLLSQNTSNVTSPVTSRDNHATDSDVDSDIDSDKKYAIFFEFLKSNVIQSVYHNYFESLKLVGNGGKRIVLAAPREDIADHLEKNMMPTLKRAALKAFNKDMDIDIVLVESE